MHDPFVEKIEDLLKRAQGQRLVLLPGAPEKGHDGWWTWKMSEKPDHGGQWMLEFSASEINEAAMVQVYPIGWTAPGLNSSVSQRVKNWDSFEPTPLIIQGLRKAPTYRYFQEPLRSKYMTAGRIATRWEERRAAFPATAFVDVDKSAIFFGFEVVIPSAGRVKAFDEQVARALSRVEAAVVALRKKFVGTLKVPSQKELGYAIVDDKLVISDPAPAATGLFGLDVPKAIAQVGGAAFFKAEIINAFKDVGWNVKNVNVPW